MGKLRTHDEFLARKLKKQQKKANKCQNLASDARGRHSDESFDMEGQLGGDVGIAARLNPSHNGFDPALAATWISLPKAKRRSLLQKEAQARAASKETALIKFPFVPDPTDHCETSPEAYQDIVPVLQRIAQRLGKADADLRIYDPYFCDGAVQRHLGSLGFESVYNRCEDFYSVCAHGAVPEHDVVVSNPPYSEAGDGGPNHVERLLRFCIANNKPYLLNMPEYVATAGYYKACFEDLSPPWLLCPYKRYYFWTPAKLKEDGTDRTHRHSELGFRCSRFAALWYISVEPVLTRSKLAKLALGGKLAAIEMSPMDELFLSRSKSASGTADTFAGTPSCRLCRTTSELPEHVARRFAKKRRRSRETVSASVRSI